MGNETEVTYNITSPIPEPYEFEKIVDGKLFLEWLDENWHVTLYISTIYAVSIYSLQHLMASRKPFGLRIPLILWNVSLAVFSIAGTLRALPGLIHMLKEFGLAFSLCDNVYGLRLQPTAFWGFLFVMSKVVELGDTFFIVLRKRKLIFLHWYHHIVTLIMVWYVPTYRVAIAYFTGIMNLIVHSFMYSYFAVRAMNFKLPKLVAMSVTLLQIVQMLANIFLISYIMYLQTTGYHCHFPRPVYNFGFTIFPSYALLFCHYFYRTYFPSLVEHPSKKEK